MNTEIFFQVFKGLGFILAFALPVTVCAFLWASFKSKEIKPDDTEVQKQDWDNR